MYDLLILVSPASSPGLQILEAAIRSEFGRLNPPEAISTSIENEGLTANVRGFRFHISFCCAPHVLEESREIAEQFAAEHPSRSDIAEASCRFELSSDDDPEMDHFNAMILICQAAETVGPVYIFHPQAGAFL